MGNAARRASRQISISALPADSEFFVTDEQPAGTAALATLRSIPVSQSLTRWTLGPILVTDGSLVRSLACLLAEHTSALQIG
jgi:hypothetical protein